MYTQFLHPRLEVAKNIYINSLHGGCRSYCTSFIKTAHISPLQNWIIQLQSEIIQNEKTKVKLRMRGQRRNKKLRWNLKNFGTINRGNAERQCSTSKVNALTLSVPTKSQRYKEEQTQDFLKKPDTWNWYVSMYTSGMRQLTYLAVFETYIIITYKNIHNCKTKKSKGSKSSHS